MHQENKPLPAFSDILNYQKPKETEERLKALIPRAKAEEDLSYYAELLAHLARSISFQQRYAEAHKMLDLAQPVLKEEMITARICYHLERGRLLNWDKKTGEALPLFQKAFDLSVKHKNDFLAVDTVHMLSNLADTFEDKVYWNKKGLAIAQTTSCPRAKKWLGVINLNLGINHKNNDKLETALEYFKASLAWNEERKFPNGTRMAKFIIAQTYCIAKQAENASKYLESLVEDMENGVDKPLGQIYLQAAECSLLLGKKDQAKSHFGRAYSLLKDYKWDQTVVFWGSRPSEEELQRMKELSEAKLGNSCKII